MKKINVWMITTLLAILLIGVLVIPAWNIYKDMQDLSNAIIACEMDAKREGLWRCKLVAGGLQFYVQLYFPIDENNPNGEMPSLDMSRPLV